MNEKGNPPIVGDSVVPAKTPLQASDLFATLIFDVVIAT